MRPTMLLLAAALGCTDKGGDDTGTPPPSACDAVDRTNCVEIAAGDVQALLDTVNTLEDDTAVVLAAGTYALDNAVTIRSVTGVTLIGQGMDETTLDFSGVAAQTNGVDVVADDVHLEGFTVVDSPKDGVRIEDSDGVVIRGVRATWSNGPQSTNGAYGLYPVRVSHVLMEDSEATNASDAGIYVGQCQHAIVRNNVARQNVAGLEIENTQFADVYGNHVEDNTGGLVVFDLPGNPVIGHDIRIHDNEIVNNNRRNFAPGGTVAQIPAGTGTFAMASRRVEIDGNTYANNDTVDVALVSGLIVESDPEQWALTQEELVGDTSGLELPTTADGRIMNFRSYDLWVHDNSHEGSGTAPDAADAQQRALGFLLAALYGAQPVDTVLYDAIGESAFDPNDAAGNSNDNRICVATGPNVTMASLNLAELQSGGFPTLADIYRPDPPFAPFDCTGVEPVAPDVPGASR
ncbi:MAG: parallel beta-helix domain-containing protein [Myxococcota bacterium]